MRETSNLVTQELEDNENGNVEMVAEQTPALALTEDKENANTPGMLPMHLWYSKRLLICPLALPRWAARYGPSFLIKFSHCSFFRL